MFLMLENRFTKRIKKNILGSCHPINMQIRGPDAFNCKSKHSNVFLKVKKTSNRQGLELGIHFSLMWFKSKC